MSGRFTKLGKAENGWYLMVACILLFISIVAIVMCDKSAQFFFGKMGAVMVDLYILWLLMVVAFNRSEASTVTPRDDHPHKLPVPHNPVALLILLIMFAAMVISFASLYSASSTVVFVAPDNLPSVTKNGTVMDGAVDTLYFSATSIMWLTPYNLSLMSAGHWIYLWELGSAILYIFLAFPVMTTLMSSD